MHPGDGRAGGAQQTPRLFGCRAAARTVAHRQLLDRIERRLERFEEQRAAEIVVFPCARQIVVALKCGGQLVGRHAHLLGKCIRAVARTHEPLGVLAGQLCDAARLAAFGKRVVEYCPPQAPLVRKACLSRRAASIFAREPLALRVHGHNGAEQPPRRHLRQIARERGGFVHARQLPTDSRAQKLALAHRCHGVAPDALAVGRVSVNERLAARKPPGGHHDAARPHVRHRPALARDEAHAAHRRFLVQDECRRPQPRQKRNALAHQAVAQRHHDALHVAEAVFRQQHRGVAVALGVLGGIGELRSVLVCQMIGP